VDREALPLTEAFYYILATLYHEPLHGYAMMQEVEKMSNGRVSIGAGTLYTALNTLVKKRFIKHMHEPNNERSRRKMYMITREGRHAFATEIKRLNEMAEVGRNVLKRKEASYGEKETGETS
jgi:DNA-binding PadR family transcriptional regulator